MSHILYKMTIRSESTRNVDKFRIRPLNVLGRKSVGKESVKKRSKKHIVDAKSIIENDPPSKIAKASKIAIRVGGRVAGGALGYILGNVPGAIAGYKIGGHIADVTGPADAKTKAHRLGKILHTKVKEYLAPAKPSAYSTKTTKRNFSTTPVSGRSAAQGSRGQKI